MGIWTTSIDFSPDARTTDNAWIGTGGGTSPFVPNQSIVFEVMMAMRTDTGKTRFVKFLSLYESTGENLGSNLRAVGEKTILWDKGDRELADCDFDISFEGTSWTVNVKGLPETEVSWGIVTNVFGLLSSPNPYW